jgi:hypothetical protein
MCINALLLLPNLPANTHTHAEYNSPCTLASVSRFFFCIFIYIFDCALKLTLYISAPCMFCFAGLFHRRETDWNSAVNPALAY